MSENDGAHQIALEYTGEIVKKLFAGLSIFLVLCGFMALLADTAAIGVGLLAIGMAGLGFAAYKRE